MIKKIFYFLIVVLFTNIGLYGQCGNFNNSIIVPAAGTVNNCNLISPSPTATICADFNITFSNGNASFYWGYTIDGVNTTFGPINSNQTSQFPNIVCVEISCGSSISFFITAYSNPNGGGSVCGGANATVVTSPFIPLPIDLISFKIENEKAHSKLVWITASEINNDYFTVEKSKDGYQWEPIATITGAGNSTKETRYEYPLDEIHLKHDTYWRMKQTDYDGKFDYSDVLFVKGLKALSDYAEIYPNPAQNTLYIKTNEPKSETNYIKISDMTGKLIKTYQEYVTELDIHDLMPGLYTIEMQNEKGSIKKIFNKI
jgi:hypothetical protein